MTNDQINALAFLDAYLATTKRGKSSFASLKGYAGVGKTWLIAHWVEQLLEQRPDMRISIVAPTNKAVDVLRAKIGHLRVDFRTLDSYLGFRVKRNEDAQMERSRSTKGASVDDEPDLVICDEGSMVKSEYHKELGWRRVPVLYVLDPAQLEPVGDTDGMPAAQVERSFTMTEVQRQAADSPIIQLAHYMRERVYDKQWFTLQDVRQFAKPGDGRLCFTNLRNVHDWADRAIDRGMDCQILAFTNIAVAANNAAMHARRYPDDPLFGEGELALVNEAFDYDDDTLLCNGETLRVVGAEQVDPVAGVDVYEVRALRLASSLVVNGETVGNELVMKVARDPEHAMRTHRALTDRIYELRREGKIGEADKLFDERRPLNKLAPLRHNYSKTVHKSQGSTYDVAICDFPDIYRSREMRARLLYVGFTRPSQYLCIAHGG